MINITTISNALCSTVPLHCLCWEPRENSEPLPSVVLRNDSRKPRFELKFSPASFLLFVSVTFVLSVPHNSSAQLDGKSYNRWHVVFIPQRQRPGFDDLILWSKNYSPTLRRRTVFAYVKPVKSQRQKKSFYFVKTQLKRWSLSHASILSWKPGYPKLSSQSERTKKHYSLVRYILIAMIKLCTFCAGARQCHMLSPWCESVSLKLHSSGTSRQKMRTSCSLDSPPASTPW